MLFNEFEKRTRALLTRWSDVEEEIKKAELLTQKVSIPAINELRYAGRAIIRAFVSSDDADSSKIFERAINNAEQYLTNASHDIVDSTVLFFGRRIDDLNYRFGKQNISNRYSDYDRLVELLEICRRDISVSRKGTIEQRMSLYNIMGVEYLPEMRLLFKCLIDTEVAMAAEIDEYKQRILDLTYNNANLKLYNILLFGALLIVLFFSILKFFVFVVR